MSVPARRAAFAVGLALLAALSTLVAAPSAFSAGSDPAAATSRVAVELFVRPGCPHCAAAEAFLADLARADTGVAVTVIDVERDPDQRARLLALARNAGLAQPGIPAVSVAGALVVGFDTPQTTGTRIRALVDVARGVSDPASVAAVVADAVQSGAAATLPECPDTGASGVTARGAGISADAGGAASLSCPAPGAERIRLPFTQVEVSLDDLGLPLFTVLIGALDGFNPCSMWVLLLMLSLLAGVGDRRRMLAIAGTFVVVQGIVYYAFMAAWLNVFLLVGLSRPSEIVIGVLALVAGALNVKDFVSFGRGPSLAIPAAAKPGIYQRLRGILTAPGIAPALAGTVVLGLLVQVIELLCTSGFPALYTRILTLRALDGAAYYGYLLLYDAVYMVDDLVVLGIGVATLSAHRLQEREGRWLKLVAGLVMMGLGIWLLAAR